MTGRILIADDEPTFLESTADLLRRDGYEVHGAPNATAALELLRSQSFDLLIADINMPGNPDLELVREVRRLDGAIPVILVTGYPATRTAIQAVQLAVVDYLVKPFELSALRGAVQSSLERSAIYRSVTGTQARLRDWLKDLQDTQALLASPERMPTGMVAESYLASMLQNMLSALQELRGVFDVPGGATRPPEGVEGAARTGVLIAALRDAITVLERTKGSFKSRQLRQLREKLEQIVQHQTP